MTQSGRFVIYDLPLFVPGFIATRLFALQLPKLSRVIKFDAAILVSNEPVDGTKRQDRRGKREELHSFGRSQIEDHHLADDGEKRNQDHRAHLHDVFLPTGHDKKRPLKLERDDDGEDRAEYGLEHRILGRIEGLRGDDRMEDLEPEVPHGEDDDDGDQARQDENNELLESFVDLINPNFAAMAEAVGILGIRLEDPAEVEEGITAAFAHDGPVVIDAVVNRTELAMPPSVTLEMAKGFSLYMVKAILSGRADEVIDLTRTNLWR